VREAGAVELPVRRPWKRRHSLDGGRDHIVGERRRDEPSDAGRVQIPVRRGYHHGHQQGLTVRGLLRDDGGLGDVRVGRQPGLDLFELDPVPSNLHLRVQAAEELQDPVLTLAHPVAAPVDPAPRHRSFGEDREALPIRVLTTEITDSQRGPR